jgi:hypothetical protein
MTGIQVYAMMKYIEENHPNTRCWQRLYFSIIEKLQSDELGFNEQYSYFYMLMARKNLDQPAGRPKNSSKIQRTNR